MSYQSHKDRFLAQIPSAHQIQSSRFNLITAAHAVSHT